MIGLIGRDGMRISLAKLFFSFLKIGAFTFGGGYAMIPLFEREFVKRYGYLDEDEFYDVLVICQSLPGVIAINFSVFIGIKLRGKVGGFVAGLGVALPSFLIILVIAAFLFAYIENPYVEAAFKGVRVSVIALIFTAGFRLFKQNKHLFGVFMAVLTFALVAMVRLHPFFVILAMGAFGYITTKVGEVVRHASH